MLVPDVRATVAEPAPRASLPGAATRALSVTVLATGVVAVSLERDSVPSALLSDVAANADGVAPPERDDAFQSALASALASASGRPARVATAAKGRPPVSRWRLDWIAKPAEVPDTSKVAAAPVYREPPAGQAAFEVSLRTLSLLAPRATIASLPYILAAQAHRPRSPARRVPRGSWIRLADAPEGLRVTFFDPRTSAGFAFENGAAGVRHVATPAIELEMDDMVEVRFVDQGTGNGFAFRSGADAAATDVPNVIAVTVDVVDGASGREVRLYVDGVLKRTVRRPATEPPAPAARGSRAPSTPAAARS
jgi:hypothetical protein